MTDAQLEALIAVAECGSFTHAARRLGRTQSAVSHAVTGLERALRAALVVRAADGARLTGVGAQVVEHAREILRRKAAVQEAADAARRLEGATVRVGSFGVSASHRLLPPLLKAFHARHPQVAVEVREGTDDEAEAWLRDGAVDVAFVNLPCDAFEAVPVAEDALHAVLPAGHELARAGPLPPARLTGLPFIMTTGGCEPLVRAAAGEARLDVRYRIREVASILSMVSAGLGISLIPRLALPDAPPSTLAFVPILGEHRRRIGLAVRRSEHERSPARRLLRLAQRRAVA